MTQINRLDKSNTTNEPSIDYDQPIGFVFNGKPYQGYHGDTVASALLANGVSLVARSFKYGRPRGIMTAGSDEPNAILQIGQTAATQVPNVRATQQQLYEGLVCRSTTGWPSLSFDLKSLFSIVAGKLMPPGFYYKTFMAPRRLWMTYEKVIRKGAGLGDVPLEPDPDIYDTINQHVDVLVIGAGPAGLIAAYNAALCGVSVILADEHNELGGTLLGSCPNMEGSTSKQWILSMVAKLEALDNVTCLINATVNGYHDHNFLTIHQQLTDHYSDSEGKNTIRQRLHRVRAQQVVLATGAQERPLVYANNDVPGCMVASAVSTYINRYAVVPGNRLVLMTTNDYAYRTAFDWHVAGRAVVAIVDARDQVNDVLKTEADLLGIEIITSSVVYDVVGKCRVSAAKVSQISPSTESLIGSVNVLSCDTIATSGGWSPVVHLSSHTGHRPEWKESIQAFVPSVDNKKMIAVGAANGLFSLADIVNSAASAGVDAAVGCGAASREPIFTPVVDTVANASVALFHVPHAKDTASAPKQFVDYQLDVTAAGVEVAVMEGYESIEHVKRYTALGFGTDQGKLGNINGMAIAAKHLGQSIPETGTTMFRPNYTPVTFGAIAGRNSNEFFDAERYTALHQWHIDNGAVFEDVGQWKRPWYFPLPGETMHDAVNRECLATRAGVGIIDASTLGKIDIQGSDAREFLNRIYTNAWSKLAVGSCRYGLMCGDDGMVFDDGVTTCINDEHFLMTTTTGGAAHVYQWLELWHQTEWPELEVYFNSVTDHWATMSISGPKARHLLAELTDIDLDPVKFKFMQFREGKVGGVPARLFRISFTGEQSYEINVQANYAMCVWQQLIEVGQKYQITPYGTETMHVLRAEKGFIIVGQDTDGSMTPFDLGMNWAVAQKKTYSFVGKRGMQREDCIREERKQLVGVKTLDPDVVLQEGSQIVLEPDQAIPMTMVGHITSSYYSAVLKSSIALAVIKGGVDKMDEMIFLPQADGTVIKAKICGPVFYDPEGLRQHE